MKALQKTFIRHYYKSNMIVSLSKTVRRLEAQFLRFQRVAVFFLFVFEQMLDNNLKNQFGNLVAITDRIQTN